ncbi:DoxX family protein [Bacillus sp. FJAT-29790]|uniref:DoxX family protein n=1 Tax=Bacillus sp. FJAT-29790 TaxID=1895002 RepID=UPI001C24A49C|nr:DoxX family protein [Bacillus sp. FJAT-29790]MBU8880570.1 DoxX family protein [Bacillus sp. FJAT-29790]
MNTPQTTINLIRYVVAYVFITSGFMKLISTDLGNYFINLGLPYPHITMYVIAYLEMICGIFILVNKSVKNAAIPLIAIMIAAILLTKIPTLNTGFMQFAFISRLDIIMLVLLFILYTRSPR